MQMSEHDYVENIYILNKRRVQKEISAQELLFFQQHPVSAGFLL